MGALDVVRSLLKAGIRADDYLMHFNDQPAIIEAATTGNLECVELLLGACNVNRAIRTLDFETHSIEVSIVSKLSNLHLFLSSLTDKKILTHNRRDHVYPGNSFREVGRGVMIDFSLENQSHSRTLDMILESGADVNLTWEPTVRDNIGLIDLYHENHIPLKWQITLLEQSYYQNIKLFNRLAPYSTRSIGRITRSGICLSAKQGKGILLEYLVSKPAEPNFNQAAFLELVLAEQFLITGMDTDAEVVRGLVEFGVDPRLPSLSLNDNFLLYQLLINAQKHGCNGDFYDIVTLLLQSGMAIDSNVLEAGVEKEGIDLLLDLSHHGADIRKYGAAALLTAACIDNYEAVSWLLEAGVDINAVVEMKSESYSIIALASYHLDFSRNLGPATCEMLRHLIHCGAVPKNSPHDLNAFEFLHHLLSRSSSDRELSDKILLVLGTIVDQHDLSRPGSCLLEASISQHPQQPPNLGKEKRKQRLAVFELLFRRGAPVRDSHVLASLIYYEGRHELINEVLDAGVDTNAYSQLSWDLSRWDLSRWDDVVCLLITPIQAAAARGKQALVDQLIRRGVDVNQPGIGFRARTALQAACEWDPISPDRKIDKLNLVQFLIENGAEVNAPAVPDAGLTALQAAACRGDMETVLLLIHYKADLNAPPSKERGECALDGAAARGRLDMVQFLLGVGALSYIRGKTGYDGAIEAAEFEGNRAVADLIRQHAENDIRLYGANLAMTFLDETTEAA
ncbi:ankyrin repeat-containing domain protein [Annulohypoxylon bovei var. microspora]|nr:ankyrin repeat-containing domain protein [Annulohypoxylon bovei var. microspora]